MTSRVLVAIDLSEPSDEAVLQAAPYLATQGAALAVCHVLPALRVNALFPQRNQPATMATADFERAARDHIGAHLARIAPGVDAEIFIEFGDAYAGIVRCAETWSADLIVVASSGRTGLARMLLGSVAEKTVRYAHCPVLVARPRAGSGVVLAATDFSDPSLPAVAMGAEEAKRRGARLVVMHALDFTTVGMAVEQIVFANITTTSDGNVDQVLVDAAHRRLVEALRAVGAEGEVRVVNGGPASAIVRTADELRAEIVVVGTHGATGLRRLSLGNVAERVVRHAEGSVLAVRLRG
jgi:nucleotide-binding universal stress UspA family protein